jgi:uncharacterized protein YjbJ (UPF0337 family)
LQIAIFSDSFVWGSLRGVLNMPGKLQEIKGKVETALGKVLKSEKLKRAGSVDQAAGQMKQAVSKAKRMAIKDINQAARAVKKGKTKAK